MFSTVSMTGTGMLTLALSFLLSYLGVNAGTSQIAGWVNDILDIAGLFMAILGQLRRKDLSMGLFRK